jgi:hypothetical protein
LRKDRPAAGQHEFAGTGEVKGSTLKSKSRHMRSIVAFPASTLP